MLSRRQLLRTTAGLALAGALPGRLALAASPVLPLLQEWQGPLQSPALDRIRVIEFADAFQVAFQEHLAEMDAIVAVKERPDFANTIAALERSGKPLTRVASLFNTMTSSMNDDSLQAVERDVSPKLASHQDAVYLKPGLYERVAAVGSGPDRAKLSEEQARVAERYEFDFRRAGARLAGGGKTRLTEINQRLASLFTQFSQNELADEEDHSVTLAGEAELAGLPDAVRKAAAAAAEEKGQKGKWVITNTRSSAEPFLTYAARRDLREKVWRMWISRGDNNDKHDNKKIIQEILALRAERAKLLGYPTHAHYRLEDSMAKTPDAAVELLGSVWRPAAKAALADRDEFQAMIDQEKGGFKLKPWDWRFYAEKVRKAKYDIDESEVKPYFQLSKIREATFWCAQQLHGLTFEPRSDVAVYHPDVRVWTVKDAGGAVLGLFYFDPYARAGKNSGAWMNELRTAEHFDGVQLPLVFNCCNFVKPAAGQEALLSVDDVETTFHEFGHAMHGLLSRAAYPLVAGTNVARDFVEFPSQLNEHWALRPEVLDRFAVHHKTGQAMPKSLVERIGKARVFNSGFEAVEIISSAWVDMELHLAGDKPIDIAAFEKQSLDRLGMPAEIVLRHRPPHFGHIFASDGYSAGYYSYVWSQVLDADGFAAFTEAGNVFDPATARRLREEVLTRGNSRDPAVSWRAFRGRDPDPRAWLKIRGFA